MARRIDWHLMTASLLEFAKAHPEGFTVDQAMEHLGEPHMVVNRAIRQLRDALSEDDMNLAATPAGLRQRWIYTLVGNLQDARPWTSNRIIDSEARLRNIRNMLRSVVNGSDKRTNEGRRAVVMHRALNRLVEDLDDLIEVDDS